MAAAKSEGPSWADHIRRLGRQVRRARFVLNLSQVELARRSGVSQGGVSRLEAGRGLGTPLVTFLKIYLVLVEELRRRDPRTLDDDMRELLTVAERLPPWFTEAWPEPPPLVRDPDLEQLIRIYREVPPAERPGFLSVMNATATTLSGRSPAPRPFASEPPGGSGSEPEAARPVASAPLAELFAQLFAAAAKGRTKDPEPPPPAGPPHRNDH